MPLPLSWLEALLEAVAPCEAALADPRMGFPSLLLSRSEEHLWRLSRAEAHDIACARVCGDGDRDSGGAGEEGGGGGGQLAQQAPPVAVAAVDDKTSAQELPDEVLMEVAFFLECNRDF